MISPEDIYKALLVIEREVEAGKDIQLYRPELAIIRKWNIEIDPLLCRIINKLNELEHKDWLKQKEV